MHRYTGVFIVIRCRLTVAVAASQPNSELTTQDSRTRGTIDWNGGGAMRRRETRAGASRAAIRADTALLLPSVRFVAAQNSKIMNCLIICQPFVEHDIFVAYLNLINILKKIE